MSILVVSEKKKCIKQNCVCILKFLMQSLKMDSNSSQLTDEERAEAIDRPERAAMRHFIYFFMIINFNLRF